MMIDDWVRVIAGVLLALAVILVFGPRAPGSEPHEVATFWNLGQGLGLVFALIAGKLLAPSKWIISSSIILALWLAVRILTFYVLEY